MTRWIVDSELRQRAAIPWGKAWLEAFDLGQLEWVRIDNGRGQYEGVYGRCWFPDEGKGFRISCQVPGPYPMKQRTYLKPVYRQPDGSWESKPKGARVAQHWEAEGGREWLTVYRNVPIQDQDEAIVWIIGHEAFHFLRKTRQIRGRNVEWQADAFGCDLLERWRAGQREGQLRLF